MSGRGGAAVRASRWDLSHESVMENFLAFVGNMRLSGKRPIFELVAENRSLSQNDMFWALFAQIAAAVGDQTVEDIRLECKLTIGVPIMRAASEDFRYVYDLAVKPLEYQQKLSAMKWFEVTSKMNKKQGSEFIDEVLRVYSQRGISLIHPSDTP